MKIPSNVADGIFDQGGLAPSLCQYVFTAVSAACTLTGFFVDPTGLQASAEQSYSISTVTTLTALYNAANSVAAGTALPQQFVGFIGNFSQPVYVGLGGQGNAAALYNPATNYPIIPATTYNISLGHVSAIFGQTSNINGTPVFKFSAGGPGVGQAIKQVNSAGGVSINTGYTGTIYTVTAGKTLYITDVQISCDSATATLAQLKAGATVIYENYISTTGPWTALGIESQPTVGAGVALSLVIATQAGHNATYFVAGFEQ